MLINAVSFQKVMQPVCRVAVLVAASIFSAPAAIAQTSAPLEQGGIYMGLSGGVVQPIGTTDIRGDVGSGTFVIPFTGSVEYRAGLSGRAAIGYEERIQTPDNVDDTDQVAPRYRAELEALMLQARRTRSIQGLLAVEPDDSLKAQVIFANGYLRLLGKNRTRLWVGAGLGNATVSLPDARRIAPCACLAPAKGKGLAYQAKLALEIRLAPRLQFVIEAALVSLPGLATAEGQRPNASYAKSTFATADIGLRLSF
ncbi:MAG: hypothetical protein RLZZ227_1741 [Pseudomonadota bacterium]|jgi:hypothetical protein